MQQLTHLYSLRKPTVKHLTELVGGEIDIIYIDNETQLVVKEFSDLDGSPVNVRATNVYRKVEPSGFIYGNAVILQGVAS